MTKRAGLDWAEMVDLLASEYGWTIEYIGSLDLGQVTALLRAIKARYARQHKASEDSVSDSPSSEEGDFFGDFKAMGGVERTREDGRKEIIL